MTKLKQHIVVVGPTASSKSNFAISLAQQFENPELISLDSMQIYKGFEIGTGVMGESDQQGIVHHMLTFQEPTDLCNAKIFSEKVMNIISSSNEKFILVGGTGLYTHGIIDGFNFAPADEKVRQSIIDEYQLDENNPNPERVAIAYKKLVEVDPISAEKIDSLNVRRIIRALEVIKISGEKFSDTFEENGVQTFGNPKLDCKIIGLRYTRENLRSRIETRIREMFENGWVDEVRELMPIWDDIVQPARLAIGYEQIKTYIENGEKAEDLNKTIELIVNKTMQFSRRQRKWFERDPRISWIDCDDLTYDEIVQKGVALCG